MTYDIELSEIALDGIKQLKKAGELQALKKLNSLLSELEEHPKTGTGKPEQLRGIYLKVSFEIIRNEFYGIIK